MSYGILPARAVGAVLADHGGVTEHALVECAHPSPDGLLRCPNRRRVEQSAGMSDEQITAVLAEHGWTVGPTRCPEHAS